VLVQVVLVLGLRNHVSRVIIRYVGRGFITDDYLDDVILLKLEDSLGEFFRHILTDFFSVLSWFYKMDLLCHSFSM
jgi:hypothetical protein